MEGLNGLEHQNSVKGTWVWGRFSFNNVYYLGTVNLQK